MVKAKPLLQCSIRPMDDRDIPQSIEIDREAYPNQWPHPTYTTYKQELCNRLAKYIVAFTKNDITAESAPNPTDNTKSFWNRFVSFFTQEQQAILLPPPSRDYIIGLAGFWLMVGEAHIISVAVRNNYQRQGIGERLLIALIELAIENNAQVVTLEVRVSNRQAQALYDKYGFHKVGLRKRYYTDNGEDAFVMTTDVISSPVFLSNFNQMKKMYAQKWDYSLNGGL